MSVPHHGNNSCGDAGEATQEQEYRIGFRSAASARKHAHLNGVPFVIVIVARDTDCAVFGNATIDKRAVLRNGIVDVGVTCDATQTNSDRLYCN
jgi:hypothetical protein